MTKQEFLEKLRAALGNDLSGAVVSENVNYYKHYITDEVAKGKSEKEVIDELGDPWAIACTIIDAQENQEYTEGEYRSETTANSEYDSGKQNRYGNVHVFGLDSWWKKLLLILGLVGIIVLIVAVIGGIISILAPIVIPLVVLMWILRVIGQRRR